MQIDMRRNSGTREGKTDSYTRGTGGDDTCQKTCALARGGVRLTQKSMLKADGGRD